jgi:hypothetical protein
MTGKTINSNRVYINDLSGSITITPTEKTPLMIKLVDASTIAAL